MTNIFGRARAYVERNAARSFFRRPVDIRLAEPLISFTFDDFPRTALHCGGEILKGHGAKGTYYTALGLEGTSLPSGPAFKMSDLARALEDGHELGCHTFAHCHAWQTKPAEFERSVMENAEALAQALPGERFRSHSFPISSPRPQTKQRVARHFMCCRGGGQIGNFGRTDLNQLSAFFLEKVREDIQPIQKIIEQNRSSGGWMVFATHDVAANPSPYGVTPDFFEAVVACASASGARILPVSQALDLVLASNATPRQTAEPAQ